MSAEQVLRIASGFVGVKESPPGSNNCIFNTHYYGREVSGSQYPWCASFVWDVFRLAGEAESYYRGGRTAYVPTLQTWGRQDGLLASRDHALPGDLLIFDWDGDGSGDHVGILEQVDADGSYVTIEGNTSTGSDSDGGQVQRRLRQPGQVCMVIRPPYTPDFTQQLKPVPQWAKGAVERFLRSGALIGEGNGDLNLSHDLLRMLVILDRTL